jgi:hypothetical protein
MFACCKVRCRLACMIVSRSIVAMSRDVSASASGIGPCARHHLKYATGSPVGQQAPAQHMQRGTFSQWQRHMICCGADVACIALLGAAVDAHCGTATVALPHWQYCSCSELYSSATDQSTQGM